MLAVSEESKVKWLVGTVTYKSNSFKSAKSAWQLVYKARAKVFWSYPSKWDELHVAPPARACNAPVAMGGTERNDPESRK
ncbi:hypothetical protein Y1Q_0003469 [Alligator mississippiensis]|uniref:Uncharacterized protein n=1 Tax=Alligator mississippiensis TaxID=8496 RepID=A0A151M466_ALLMI|nr:hypothetical protein Y1Q_0003469 [Alligator mississippiensis]